MVGWVSGSINKFFSLITPQMHMNFTLIYATHSSTTHQHPIRFSWNEWKGSMFNFECMLATSQLLTMKTHIKKKFYRAVGGWESTMTPHLAVLHLECKQKLTPRILKL